MFRTFSPAVVRESSLTSAALCDALASNRTSLRVGPMRRQGQYHGRVVTFPQHAEMEREDALRLVTHAAQILSTCDGFDVTVLADGVSLAVISRRP